MERRGPPAKIRPGPELRRRRLRHHRRLRSRRAVHRHGLDADTQPRHRRLRLAGDESPGLWAGRRSGFQNRFHLDVEQELQQPRSPERPRRPATARDGSATSSRSSAPAVRRRTHPRRFLPRSGTRRLSKTPAPGRWPITVGDAETAAGSLTLSGSTSNATLVPAGNIVFGGSGANRTVTVTPAPQQSGTATVTVTVSDGQATASTSFLLTVTAVNDPPTISSVGNQTTSAGVAVGPLAVHGRRCRDPGGQPDAQPEHIESHPRAGRQHCLWRLRERPHRDGHTGRRPDAAQPRSP